MKVISDWLKNEDYNQGVELYRIHGNSNMLLTFLEKGENHFTRKKLKEALESLILESHEKPNAVVEKPISHVQKEYPNEAIQLFKERAMLHEQLKHQTNDSDRCKVAFRIRAICKRIELVLAPPPDLDPIELPENVLELVRIRNNNRPYISKYKNDPLKQGEILRRQKENELIEDKLKSMN